jgi:hypothetical protein
MDENKKSSFELCIAQECLKISIRDLLRELVPIHQNIARGRTDYCIPTPYEMHVKCGMILPDK